MFVCQFSRLIYKNLQNSNKQFDTIYMATDIIIHDEKDNVGVVVIEKITPKIIKAKELPWKIGQ